MGRNEGSVRDGAVRSSPVQSQPPRRFVSPAEKTLSSLAWPETVDKLQLQGVPALRGEPHLITEPGKVPSPVYRRLQAEPEEDEQLLSLQWADENQTRANVPMDLSCQFSLQSDEAAQSGGGRERVVPSRKPQLQLLGRRQTEMEIFSHPFA